MITHENEIEIDEQRYIPYLKIRKYYSKPQKISVAIEIDFEAESVEVQRTQTGTTLFNHSCYDMSADTIKEGYPLFERTSIENCQEIKSDIIDGHDVWYVAKYYDIAGHKHKILFLPEDVSNPLQSILQWLKSYYEEFEDVMEF